MAKQKDKDKEEIFIRNFFNFEDTVIYANFILTIDKTSRWCAVDKCMKFGIIINKDIEQSDNPICNKEFMFFEEEFRDKRFEDLNEAIVALGYNEIIKI